MEVCEHRSRMQTVEMCAQEAQWKCAQEQETVEVCAQEQETDDRSFILNGLLQLNAGHSTNASVSFRVVFDHMTSLHHNSVIKQPLTPTCILVEFILLVCLAVEEANNRYIIWPEEFLQLFQALHLPGGLPYLVVHVLNDTCKQTGYTDKALPTELTKTAAMGKSSSPHMLGLLLCIP